MLDSDLAAIWENGSLVCLASQISMKGMVILMAKLTFKEDICKGCGLCVYACPKKLIVIAKDKINKKGHSPAAITDMSECIGCAFCATMCPDCVITVEK